ncbi:chloride channel protein CLC-c-like protein [Tanacetum coccineum]|uniref:Chloride channel protein CLC-c-like protein n=1 Tax=Tanacetum coccineum TaxID=301880 RepID=A0ABQ5AUQ4_9ASTR
MCQIFNTLCHGMDHTVLLIGLATGLVAFFNNNAVENIDGFKLLLTDNLMLKQNAVIIRVLFHLSWYVNVVLATCAAVRCAYIAPAAAGSGIPEVKAYLNGVDAHSILPPSTLFVKVDENSIVLIVAKAMMLDKNVR